MTMDPGALALTGLQAARLAQPAEGSGLAPAVVAPAAGAGASGGGFLSTFERVVTAVDAQGQAAGAQMSAVSAGQSDDLVGAMLASQEASLSFSMLMQVRNKVMSAVDDLSRLQV